MRSRVLAGLAGLVLAGCGTHPVGPAVSVQPGVGNTSEKQAQREMVQPVVSIQSRDVNETDAVFQGGVPDGSAVVSDDLAEPAEGGGVSVPEPDVGRLRTDEGLAPQAVADTSIRRTDASGMELSGGFVASGPVYLTPRDYPLLLPGRPSTLPEFTPRVVDTTRLPVDAFAELSRLGRLRERVRGRMAWLVGYSFPKLDAIVARARLEAGQVIYLAPNGHHWNRDRAYAEVGTVGQIEGMLAQLRQEALGRAQREAREANIRDRMRILPAFNQTFDILKLIIWDWVVDDYRYGDQPVRRGLVASANWFEFDEVKRQVATYWEEHPDCTALELRRVAMRALNEKIRNVERSASSYASNPSVYRDMQAMPGLRDPRPVVDGDRSDYEADVAYNLRAIRSVCQSMPAWLNSAVFTQ